MDYVLLLRNTLLIQYPLLYLTKTLLYSNYRTGNKTGRTTAGEEKIGFLFTFMALTQLVGSIRLFSYRYTQQYHTGQAKECTFYTGAATKSSWIVSR